MNTVTFLVKPASSLCDLRCRYCFYRDISDLREVTSTGIMAEDTARALISAALDAVGAKGTVQFTFQGGEPTLAGLDFFRRFLEIEAEYRKPGQKIYHSLQTNGMTLDENWAAFLKKKDFLVGLSLDGTEAIHDSFRVTKGGSGTWQRVTESLRLLEKHGVETSLLCVVTGTLAKNPEKVYRSLKNLGNHTLQFIPCLDPMEEPRGSQPHSLKPQAYGKFLCRLFDLWYRDWKEGYYTSIRLFDDYLRLLLGMPPGNCGASGRCGNYLVVEGDGSLYPCDFYVLDEWKLGNIRDTTVEAAMASPVNRRFRALREPMPESCRACPYLSLCRTGCLRDWTERRENYYCAAYRQFFAYALPRLREMAAAVPRR